MTFDWQQVSALAVVAFAAALFVRSELRRRKRAKLRACGGDCGCGASGKLTTTPLHTHSRKIS